MRPYRRKHHSRWRTRRAKGAMKRVAEFIQPFICSTKAVWKLEPPFPITAKIGITVLTWFLLFLPLCYFFTPLLTFLFLVNYFGKKINFDRLVIYLAEACARATWLKKVLIYFKFLDRISIIFFLYDYYQILRCLQTD